MVLILYPLYHQSLNDASHVSGRFYFIFLNEIYMYIYIYIMHLGTFEVVFLYVELQSVKLNSIQLQKAWDLNREPLAYK